MGRSVFDMPDERQGKRGARRGGWLAVVLAFASCSSGGGGVAPAPTPPTAEAPPEAPTHAALERFSFEHPAMGTLFRATLYAPDAEAARAAADAAFDAVDRIEAAATDYDSESEARRLPELALDRPHVLSEELLAVVAAADSIARLSGGAFDPSVGALTPEWRRALRRRRWPDAGDWAGALARVGWAELARFDAAAGTLELTAPGMRVDFGAVAKGVAVDAALRTLSGLGIESALVDGGGDLGASGPPPGQPGWRVSVRPGGEAGGALGECRALLAHGAVATSGDAYRSAEGLDGEPLPGVDDPAARFGHVLDARSGAPLPAPRASVVFAPTAARADGLATALLVLGRPALKTAPFAAAAFVGGPDCQGSPCVGPAFPQDGAAYRPEMAPLEGGADTGPGAPRTDPASGSDPDSPEGAEPPTDDA